ncbi:hypothetical protein ACIHDR_03815 [Nocardia sp. NPDC052278]|uniref:Gfo/Idh/MocA family protein n=1 Tax=unclassified Nocardia TaxID=2637762 RepID=UPI0036B022F6
MARARQLLAEGYVGDVVSVTVYSARHLGAGTRVPPWAAYTLDQRNGAGIVEIVGGHTLDTVEYLIGAFTDLSARLAIRHPHAVIEETGAAIDVTTPNHLLLDAVTADGVVVSAHIHDSKVTNGHTRIRSRPSRTGSTCTVCSTPSVDRQTPRHGCQPPEEPDASSAAGTTKHAIRETRPSHPAHDLSATHQTKALAAYLRLADHRPDKECSQFPWDTKPTDGTHIRREYAFRSPAAMLSITRSAGTW